MNLRHSLANTFNVHPGEGWTTILLTGFSFLIGIFMSYFISLANAFYLGDFGAEYLPHGYLVTGVVGYLSGILLARIQRYLSYKKLIFSLVVLPLILTCLFRIGLWQTSSKWLSFVMFVSIGPFVTFIYFALFSLMGRLFNLRQGKRLFGLVNSGDVVSSIMGFFSLPILLHFFENSANLLWIAGGGLGLCVVVLNEVFRRFPDQLIVTQTGQEKRSSSRFLELVKRRYFVLLFLMLMATVVGFYYADYILLTSLDIRFKANKTLLAQFIAMIYGLIKVVELIAKMLSGRLISQYGIGFGLMALPVLLCVFTSLGAVAGTIFGNESSIFFLMIVASKLIERVVTRSLFEPAFNILYQPLDAELRLDVQTKAEMIVQPVTVGITGLTLLIFNWYGALTLVVGVLGVVALAWSFGSYLLYREYRQFLLQNLTQKLDQTATTSRDDISSVDLLMGKLQDGNARGAISAYRLLKRVSPASIDRLVQELLTHTEPEVRQMVLEDVGQMGYVSILEDVERQAAVEKEQQVRETALETLERLRQLGVEAEPKRLMELAHSPSSSDRTLAAMLLGNSEQALPVLPELLRDDHREVRKAALLAAGKTHQTDLWEKMVDHLTPPAFSNAATSALTLVGEPVLPVLAAAFSPQNRSPLALLRIAWIYGAVGGEKAIAWLAQRINYSDFLVRRQVLKSLLFCGYRAQNGQSTAVNREIEEALDNSLWCIAALLDLTEEHRLTQLKIMLGGEIDQNREQVFRLLSLAYDARHIMLVRDSFKSGSADAKVYALELIDMFIDSELKTSLIPILDDLTLTQRLKLLELKFPQQRLAVVPRLKDIINRPYSRVERWTKAGALRALSDVGDQIEDELIAALFHPDELLRETAAWSLYQIDPAAYDHHVARLSETIREGLDQVIKEPQGSVILRLMMDKVTYLKGVEAFAAIPETDLIDLAEHVEQIQVQAGQVVFEGGDLDHRVYILVEGQVRLHIGDRTLGPWQEKEMMGGPMTQTPEKGVATATVVELARFLVIDQDDLYNLIADRVEVASSVFNALNPPPSDHSD